MRFLKNIDKDALILIIDTVLLDYIPPDIIYYIDTNGSEIPFAQVFSHELEYMWPGEILLNRFGANEDQQQRIKNRFAEILNKKTYSPN